MQNKAKIHTYRCDADAEHPVRTLGGTFFEARKSLGCHACKKGECTGPVLQKDTTTSEAKPQKDKPSPLPQVWLKGTPPQGKYTWDVGEGLLDVDVGHNVFTFNGKTRHISKAFENGVLYGPMPNPKEGKNVKRKKAEVGTAPEEILAIPIAEVLATAESTRKHPIGLDPKVDTAIREALRTLANTPMRKTAPTVAPQLIEAYGDEMRAVRKQRHGWKKIVEIFRAHGIHVGEKLLKAGLEGTR
jgi:hypothetical protein